MREDTVTRAGDKPARTLCRRQAKIPLLYSVEKRQWGDGMRSQRWAAFFLGTLMLATQAGCVSDSMFSPGEIAGNGVLVAHIDLDPRLGSPEPSLNGHKRAYDFGEGLLIVPLEPGTYELDLVLKNPGYVDTHVPLNRKFAIADGRITNLGLIVVNNNASGGIYIDNTADLKRQLTQKWPKLAAMAQKQDLTPQQTLGRDGLRMVREAFAAHTDAKLFNIGAHDRASYVTGRVGTIAKRETANGKTRYRTVEHDIIADLSRCSTLDERVACMLSANSYLWFENGTVAERPSPASKPINSIHLLRGKGVAIIDTDFAIHTSLDSGRTWQTFSGATRPDLLSAKYRHQTGIHRSETGYYLFPTSESAKNTTLLYADNGSAAFRAIPLTNTADNIRAVRASKEGIYVGPEHTLASKDQIHFYSERERKWQLQTVPAMMCSDLAIGNDSPGHVEVLCSNDAVWKSTDYGASWQRIFRVNSAFRF